MTDTPRYEVNGIGVYEDGLRIGEGDGDTLDVAAQNATRIAAALDGSEALVAVLQDGILCIEAAQQAIQEVHGRNPSGGPVDDYLEQARAAIASATPAAEEVGG